MPRKPKSPASLQPILKQVQRMTPKQQATLATVLDKAMAESSDDSGLSRQRRWQNNRAKSGNCIKCGKPVVSGVYCEFHRLEHNKRQRDRYKAKD